MCPPTDLPAPLCPQSLFPLHLLCLFPLWFSVNPCEYQILLSYQGQKYQQQAARPYSILMVFLFSSVTRRF